MDTSIEHGVRQRLSEAMADLKISSPAKCVPPRGRSGGTGDRPSEKARTHTSATVRSPQCSRPYIATEADLVLNR